MPKYIEVLTDGYTAALRDAGRYRKLRRTHILEYRIDDPERDAPDWEMDLAMAEKDADFDAVVDALPDVPSESAK